jgi:hypothetical protein
MKQSSFSLLREGEEFEQNHLILHEGNIGNPCLRKITFDSTNMEMNAEVRCSDKTQTSFFMCALSLNVLI